jgi:hypothetical protein
MQKWEYMVSGWKQVVTESGVERPQVIKYLNQVGEEGWEFVQLAFHDQEDARPMFYFKRLKQAVDK